MTFDYGKKFDIFREHESCNLLCRRLVGSVELSNTLIPSFHDITKIPSLSILVGFFVVGDRLYFEKVLTDATIKRTSICAYVLLFVDSIKPMLGTYYKGIYWKLIITGSHVTVGAPRKRGMFGGVR